jgi:hypothetical protein
MLGERRSATVPASSALEGGIAGNGVRSTAAAPVFGGDPARAAGASGERHVFARSDLSSSHSRLEDGSVEVFLECSLV